MPNRSSVVNGLLLHAHNRGLICGTANTIDRGFGGGRLVILYNNMDSFVFRLFGRVFGIFGRWKAMFDLVYKIHNKKKSLVCMSQHSHMKGMLAELTTLKSGRNKNAKLKDG